MRGVLRGASTEITIAVLVAVVVSVIVSWAVWYNWERAQATELWCEAMGGKLDKSNSYHYLCLTPDGRVIPRGR